MKPIKHIDCKFARKSVAIIAILIFVFLTGCKSKSFEFCPFPSETADANYYAVNRYIGLGNNVIIPDEYEGKEVRYILDEGFALTEIRSIDIVAVKQICPYAFANCVILQSVKLNEVEHISRFAFHLCMLLEKITIPSTVNTIETGAFHGCDSLTNIYFEGNPAQLGDYIFSDTENLTIYGPAGGTVEEYALSYSINFIAWNVEG